ncbi:MAG: hypothetical protein IE921_13740, partial [Rhodobacteraceae bacterium]|nr:hypothetical protein [Paracoccaceae bacterium]
TDTDGDTDTATVTIVLAADSVPTVTVSDGTVDEQGLPSGTGELADGIAGNNSDSSETTSGTITIGTGNDSLGAVEVQDAGGSWVDVTAATVGTPITVSGTWGTLTVTSDGAGHYSWSYTLTSNLAHPDTDPNDGDGIEGAADPLAGDSFAVRVTDSDGDVSSVTPATTIDITVLDDAPVAVTADPVAVINAAMGSSLAYLDGDHNVDNNYGADGPGAVIFTGATILSLVSQGLTSNLEALTYTISNGGTVLTATKAISGTTVFVIEMQPVGFDDQYKITISQPIDSTSQVDFNGGGYNFVGSNVVWTGFNQPGTTGSQDLLLTPIENGVSSGSVNTNANEGGVSDGNSVKTGEAMRVDFVTDLSGSPSSSGDYSTPALQNHTFSGHYNANGANALFTGINGGTAQSSVLMTAYDDNATTGTDGNFVVGDGVQDTITSVGISYNGANLLVTVSGTYSVGGHNFTVTFSGGTAQVDGVVSNTRLAAYTADGYNSIEFENVGGQPYKIGDFGATTVTNDPVDFTVPISIQDGDGDTVDSGSLHITANPATPPIVLDLDGDGVEFTSLDAGVHYDLNGDGHADATAWVGADDAILAYDANGDGTVTDASEFVFGQNGVSDLAALAAMFDANGDAVLDASDPAYAKFGIWQDANQNGVADAGEFTLLSDAGIVSISLVSDGQGYSAASGSVAVVGTASYTTADGGTHAVADAMFASVRANREAEARTLTAAAAAGLLAIEPAHGIELAAFDATHLATSFADLPGLQIATIVTPTGDVGFHASEFTLPVSETIGGSAQPIDSLHVDAEPIGGLDTIHTLDQPDITADAALYGLGDANGGPVVSAPAPVFDFAAVGSMEALLAIKADGGVQVHDTAGSGAGPNTVIAAALGEVAGAGQVDHLLDSLLGDQPVGAQGGHDQSAFAQMIETSGTQVPVHLAQFVFDQIDDHAMSAATAAVTHA